MKCSVDGCTDSAWIIKRELCKLHYSRWWRDEHPKGSSTARVFVLAACECCGEEFEKRRGNHKFCSRKCGDKSKKGIACARCGGLVWGGKGSLPEGHAVCRPCRKADPVPRRYRDGRPKVAIQCPVCGTDFVPFVERVKTCSRSCGQIFRIQMASAQADPAERRARERERWQAKNRRRRAAKRGKPSEPYTLAEIAERDRHRCQLCRRKVNMTLKAPRPKSPTIDHVIPIADGGDDTRANVQLAHFGCNSSKGARGLQQLALVG